MEEEPLRAGIERLARQLTTSQQSDLRSDMIAYLTKIDGDPPAAELEMMATSYMDGWMDGRRRRR